MRQQSAKLDYERPDPPLPPIEYDGWDRRTQIIVCLFVVVVGSIVVGYCSWELNHWVP